MPHTVRNRRTNIDAEAIGRLLELLGVRTCVGTGPRLKMPLAFAQRIELQWFFR